MKDEQDKVIITDNGLDKGKVYVKQCKNKECRATTYYVDSYITTISNEKALKYFKLSDVKSNRYLRLDNKHYIEYETAVKWCVTFLARIQ
jgi:hypothetical protein